jgi:pimeloyl-ACP methyl ester carboxylesterase
MCVRCIERIDRLVLIDSVGVKFGGREERDVADIYALPGEELLQRSFFDAARIVPDYPRLSDDELNAIARDRQATALYAWRPYMHNPGLRQWLHRVRVPTLVIWGENDGIVTPDYGRKLCRSLPDARFEPIPQAGHHPQLEQPDRVADAIERFARAEVL